MSAFSLGIYSMCAAVMLCGLICRLLRGSFAADLARLLSGIVVLLAVIRPLASNVGISFNSFLPGEMPDSESYIRQGRDAADDALQEIISGNLEAYILDRAQALGHDLTVEVILTDTWPLKPAGLKLCGEISPYEKLMLEEILEEEFSIPKENLQWIG